MTDKELRKLKRAELLELLIEQDKETESLKERLRQAEEALKNREILLQESGSIAEAALKLNGIFEDAQRAADQYLENVKRLSEEKAESVRKRRPLIGECLAAEAREEQEHEA